MADKGYLQPLQVTGEFTTTTPTNVVTVGIDNSDPLNPVLGDIPIDFGDISHVQVSQGNIVYKLTKGTLAEYRPIASRTLLRSPTSTAMTISDQLVSSTSTPLSLVA